MNYRTQSIIAGFLPIFFLLAGCVSPVMVDYDHSATRDFSNYQCFVIDTPDETENSQDIVFNPIATRRFVTELETALEKRGYTSNCVEPDFRVHFHTARTSRTYVDFNYPNYAFGFRYNCLQPNFGFFPPPHVDQYEESTILIDIIDMQSEELVWRGAYTERLKRRPHSNAEIHAIIDKILNRFSYLKE